MSDYMIQKASDQIESGLAEKDALLNKIKCLEIKLAAALKIGDELAEFYGKRKNWIYPGNDFHNFKIAKVDIEKGVGGKFAREKQKELKELSEGP